MVSPSKVSSTDVVVSTSSLIVYCCCITFRILYGLFACLPSIVGVAILSLASVEEEEEEVVVVVVVASGSVSLLLEKFKVSDGSFGTMLLRELNPNDDLLLLSCWFVAIDGD